MTTTINYTKILLSVTVIAFVSAAVFGGTRAFFSDTETSTGNTFMAGDIDLQIDNESYAIDYNIPGYDNPTGEFVASPNTSWELADLTVEKFFNFVDLKPGDYGEDTISIHVGSNDAWVCAAAQITADDDNDITEPEDEESGSNSDGDDGTPDGDLDSELNFAFWVDDGDNVLEVGENVFINGTLEEMGEMGGVALADTSGNAAFGDLPIPGGDTVYVAKGWCFGDMELTPLPDDSDLGPLDRDTGFTCNGAGASNIAQTDSVEGDLEFYAEQARNNGEFVCSAWQPAFVGQEPPRETVGAALASYVAPEVCDVNVSGDNELAAALPGTIGQTICLDDLNGVYSGPISVTTEGLTLAAVGSPTISGGVIIDAPGVTVTGFEILPGNTEGSTAGVYLKEAADNAEISYNYINSTGVTLARGIVNVIGTDLPGVVIDNNVIEGDGTGSGIYTNPHTGLWTISNNDIFAWAAGIGQWNGADILNNEFSGGGEAIGVDDTWDANQGVVNFNNFLDDSRLNTYVGGIASTINAENNFWGPNGAAAQVDDSNISVDADPEEGSAFPQN